MKLDLAIKKAPAASVPYGEQVTTRGGYVWAVHRGDVLLGVYATAKEARRAHRLWPQRTKEDQSTMAERRYHPGGRKG